MPHLISQARVPEGVDLVNLGAWNDDPLVIQAIAEKIKAQVHHRTAKLASAK